MTSDAGALPIAADARPAPSPVDTPVRALPAVVMVGLFWAYFIVSGQIEMPMFIRFLTRMGAMLLVLLAVAVWWLTRRRVSRAERWSVAGALVVAAVASVLLADKSMGPMPIFDGMPWLLTACTAWLLLTAGVAADRSPGNLRHLGLLVLPFATLGLFTLVRLDGLRGDGRPDYHWRWGPSSEDRYLAAGHGGRGISDATHSDTQPSAATTRSAPLTLRPGDWPAFRGPSRDANVPGVRIATDWDTNPPRALWRQRVGPAWSSVVIVGDCVFTQEQRGESEAVVCRDAATGAEVWVHDDPARFWESLSGTGPRATPAFADGRLFTLGARGMLNCLDASTGRRLWSRDITADCGAKVPDWGFSGSPLVVDGVVVVYGGGKGDKDLLAYHAESGEPAWSAPAGEWSYSSPHLATINGTPQVMFLSDRGLTAVDPASGKVLWEHLMSGGSPRSVQPMPVGSHQLLVSHGMDMATALLELSAGDAGKPTEMWASRNLKPSFNDFVVHGGFIYGFDGTIFSCVDLKDGARRWKKGRYGAGQVLLLRDQPVLIVVSEQGEAVLVSTNPDTFEELGRFQAVDGKTWNHPAIAHGRLYVRSDAEMACFELRPAPQGKLMATDFPEAFAALREMLKGHSGGMIVQSDTPTDFTVVTRAFAPNGKPMWFGRVTLKKRAVTYHLMPLYFNPKLQAAVPPELARRKQGETCFNFQRPDPALFAMLDELTRRGREGFERHGLLDAGPVTADRLDAALRAGGEDPDALARRRTTAARSAAVKRAVTLRKKKVAKATRGMTRPR